MKRFATLMRSVMQMAMVALVWSMTAPSPAIALEVMGACGTPVRIVVPESDPDGSYTVSWGASATTGVTYLLQEATDAAFSSGLRTAYKGPALRTLLTGRSAGKSYFYRVRAIKAEMKMSPWNAGANGCAIRIPCATPAGITVPATAQRGSYSVNWEASTSMGVTYVLEEATDALFNTELRTVYNGPAWNVAVRGRQIGKTYYYRVKAIRTGRAASRWRTGNNGCLVLYPCAPPARILVPASDADGNYSVSWDASLTPDVTYLVQEANDRAFTAGLRTVYQGPLLTAPITKRSAGVYYYRVRAAKVGSAPSGWRSAGNGCVASGSGVWIMDLIVNLDSNVTTPNESEWYGEDRIFLHWDGTKAALPWPIPPLEDYRYDYKTSSTVYDALGASHELTVYFDRTHRENRWEFLVTCDPSEDRRVLTTSEQTIYHPDSRYNFENHKGAGALLFGILQFDTSGNIAQIEAFKVPPDGQVDPGKNDNRLRLEPGRFYFAVPTNFTGADTNQEIWLNFGARMAGSTSTLRQVLVSDGLVALEGYDWPPMPVTADAPWSTVTDGNGNTVTQGDTFIFEGYDHDSNPVTRLVYTVEPKRDIQDLLSQLEATFNCTAGIDDQGRLWLSDNHSGPSSMYVTRFATFSANGAHPFGDWYSGPIGSFAMTDEGVTSDGVKPVTSDTQLLAGLRGSDSVAIGIGDTFTFSGSDVSGQEVEQAFTVATGSTIRALLDAIEELYGGVEAGAKAVLDQRGKLRVMDLGQSGHLRVNILYDNALGGGTANPFGIRDQGGIMTLSQMPVQAGQINVTTSKKMVYANGRGLSIKSGVITPITAGTSWESVFDDNHDPLLNAGMPRRVNDGMEFSFTGTQGDGTPVSSTFVVAYRKPDGTPGTVQDLLAQLEADFACQAAIDAAGRLVLTDWTADSFVWPRALSINAVAYRNTVPAPLATDGIFGPADMAFATTRGDFGYEDGSQQGDVVTTNFVPEALSSTQYAADSTTIYQNFYGR